MSWFKWKFGSLTPEISISIDQRTPEIRRGMSVHEELTGENLEGASFALDSRQPA